MLWERSSHIGPSIDVPRGAPVFDRRVGCRGGRIRYRSGPTKYLQAGHVLRGNALASTFQKLHLGWPFGQAGRYVRRSRSTECRTEII